MATQSVDWREMARRMGRRIPLSGGHPDVLKYLSDNPSTSGVWWRVACSGGADSVALLLWIYAHFQGRQERIEVVHFNHGVRGNEADADADFVRMVAEDLSLPFHLGRRRGGGRGKSAGEAELRQARLSFFRDLAGPEKASHVWLGHHLDDVAETQLMRLFRGSGVEGLSSPRPVQLLERLILLRPFLSLPQSTLEGELRAEGIPWRLDSTNQDPRYLRNRFRREVMPAVKAVIPGHGLSGLARSRQWLAEEDEALRTWLAERLPVFPGPGEPIHLRPLFGTPRALWRRALRKWLRDAGVETGIAPSGFECLLDGMLSDPEGRIQMTIRGGRRLVYDRGRAWIQQEEREEGKEIPATRLHVDSALATPEGGVLRVERIRMNREERRLVFSGGMDPGEVCYLAEKSLKEAGWKGEFLVRAWEPGDRYHPLGARGTRKLQDCFVDRRIPAKERKRRPLVSLPYGAILWVPGLLPADPHKVTPRTRRALRLTYRTSSAACKAFFYVESTKPESSP